MAKGLGGLIGAGRIQKEQALSGLTRSAQLETQTENINRQLSAQKKAAQMNVVGTAGGITVASLLAKRGASKVASGALMSSVPGGSAGALAAANPIAAQMGLLGGTGAAGSAAAGTAAAGTAAAGSAAAGTTAAGAAATGSAGALAAAAPWAALIIGGGYLLKKLFD